MWASKGRSTSFRFLRSLKTASLDYFRRLLFYLKVMAIGKNGKTGYVACSVPVMIMLKLKLVMLPALGDADNVNVAAVD
jgi:hypothetical protein